MNELNQVKLKRTSVSLGSSLKFFSKERGVSSGSEITISYELPPDTSDLDFNLILTREKERLDLLVLGAEFVRSSISQDDFATRKLAIKRTYEKIRADLQSNSEQSNGVSESVPGT